jgi:hypothetical protein
VEIVRNRLLLALAAGMLTACSAGEFGSAASANVPPDFIFVRDGADLFPPGQVRQAEAALRSMATSSNIYGVVVAQDHIDDPSAVAASVLEDIAALDGVGMVAICTPDACDLTTATAVSPGLADAVDQVAPAPDPAPGEGLAAARRDDLRRWRELVGAVSTIER